MLWLPIACSYPKRRGSVHAVVPTSKGWFLSGGMQNEANQDMPRFKNDVSYVLPKIGFDVSTDGAVGVGCGSKVGSTLSVGEGAETATVEDTGVGARKGAEIGSGLA